MPIALLSAVQKIEIVGGESWLERNSVAIAAITAAALAALVAVSNHRAQLNHDRFLRNRDYARDAIDNAIVVANEARTAVGRFVIHLTTLEDHRDDMQSAEIRAVEKDLEQERAEVMVILHAMRAARSRLEIRFEKRDAILESYEAILLAFTSTVKATHKGIQTNRTAEVRKGDDEREKRVKSSFSAFQEACRRWTSDRPRSRLRSSFSRMRRNADIADQGSGDRP